MAATQYWDTSDTAGLQGGNGEWNLTTANWNDSTGSGTRTTWTNGNDAVFSVTGGTVTLKSPIIAPNITANVTLSFTDSGFDPGGHPNNMDVTNLTVPSGASTVTLQAKITGSHDFNIIDNTASAAQTLNVGLINGGSNDFTGNLNFNGDSTGITDWTRRLQMTLTQTNAMQNTTTFRFNRNWSQVAFTQLGASTFPNNLVLNPDNTIASSSFVGMIGATRNGASIADVNYTGVISGNGGLAFALGAVGGQGVITLGNNNTYTGNTQWISALDFVARLGVDNALPTSTGLIFGINAVAGGALDLNGHDQTVASIASSTTGTQGGIVNNQAGGSPHISVLTVNGSATTNYSGPLGSSGNPTNANLPNTANHDDLKLVLAPTNTGKQTLSRSTGNAYSGGTEINGGTLIAVNASGSATGTGAVAVNSGGTLSGTGIISGAVAVNGTGALAPGNIVTPATPVGTLTVNGGLTLNDLNVLNYDFKSGSNDMLAITNGLTITTTGNITVNLTDTDSLGIVAGNTYHLMSYAGTLSAPSDLNTVLHVGTGPANSYSFTVNGSFIDLVVSAGLSPDFNGDTKVNAADYVTWRKDEAAHGGANGYFTWRENFDLSAGAGASLGSAAVPEPATAWLLAYVLGLALVVSKRVYRRN
jgi:autotransporter-associated beta strand protein